MGIMRVVIVDEMVYKENQRNRVGGNVVGNEEVKGTKEKKKKGNKKELDALLFIMHCIPRWHSAFCLSIICYTGFLATHHLSIKG